METVSPIDVEVSIDIRQQSVAARLRFTNTGKKPILVKEGINGFGVRGKSLSAPTSLLDQEYVPTSAGVLLSYGGPTWKHAPETKENFSFMQPGEVIAVRYDRLDDAYEFLPGTHD